MNLDVLLPVLQIVVPICMAVIGYEMSHNQPQTRFAKNSYRAVFIVLLLLVLVIAIWQARRAAAQQSAANQASERRERDLSDLKGQLADMGKLLVSVVKIAETRRDKPLVASTIKESIPSMTTVPIAPPPPPVPTQAMPAETSKPLNKCDINGDGKVDVRDVQMAVNQALGNNPTLAGDVNGDRMHSVIDVQAVVTASIGGGCPY